MGVAVFFAVMADHNHDTDGTSALVSFGEPLSIRRRLPVEHRRVVKNVQFKGKDEITEICSFQTKCGQSGCEFGDSGWHDGCMYTRWDPVTETYTEKFCPKHKPKK